MMCCISLSLMRIRRKHICEIKDCKNHVGNFMFLIKVIDGMAKRCYIKVVVL